MRAIRANKQYLIDKKSIDIYVKAGYDIYDDNGELLKHGSGKTVTYEKYEEVRKALHEALENTEEGAPDVAAVLTAVAAEKSIDISKTKSVAGIAKKIKEYMSKAGE